MDFLEQLENLFSSLQRTPSNVVIFFDLGNDSVTFATSAFTKRLQVNASAISGVQKTLKIRVSKRLRDNVLNKKSPAFRVHRPYLYN